jgi:hypothetical protein
LRYFQAFECFKVLFLPVSSTVELIALIKASAVCGRVRRQKLSCQHSTSKRIIRIESNSKLTKTWNQLSLDVPGEGIVHSLVDRGENISSLFHITIDIRDLPRRIVGQTKENETALEIQLLNSFECVLDRCVDVGGMQIEDVALGQVQGLQ